MQKHFTWMQKHFTWTGSQEAERWYLSRELKWSVGEEWDRNWGEGRIVGNLGRGNSVGKVPGDGDNLSRVPQIVQ
jgi:hypothetical protein